MKKLVLGLSFALLMLSGFSQTDTQSVLFEGEITESTQMDGEFFIVVKVLNGELEVGEEVHVWIMTSFSDDDEIAYTGDYKVQGFEDDIGKIVKVVAVKSKDGEDEIWRLKEIDLK